MIKAFNSISTYSLIRKLIYSISALIIVFGTLAWVKLENIRQGRAPNENATVYIKKTDKGFILFRHGKPFFIQGASGSAHLKDLAGIGANTIRVFDTIDIKHVLDEAHENGLAVVVDIPLPKFDDVYNSYLDEDKNRKLVEKIGATVRKHKDHPALLLWNIGNELRYPYVYFKNSFIRTFNAILDTIHEIDPNHPVGTTIATAYTHKKRIASIYFHSPELDFMSLNIFSKIGDYMYNSPNFTHVVGTKPYYISEWGSDGHWESVHTSWKAPIEPSSILKSEQFRERAAMLKQRFTESCFGYLAFYWGHKQEISHTWFSIFDEDGRKSETFYALKEIWQNEKSPEIIKASLRSMLIDNKRAQDNLIFAPNEIREAKLLVEGKIDSTMKFNWEIYEENFNYYGANARQKKAKLISGRFVHPGDTMVVFRVPELEGPYRLYAYLYDENGNFSTTNIPFYVLSSK